MAWNARLHNLRIEPFAALEDVILFIAEVVLVDLDRPDVKRLGLQIGSHGVISRKNVF